MIFTIYYFFLVQTITENQKKKSEHSKFFIHGFYLKTKSLAHLPYEYQFLSDPFKQKRNFLTILKL